MSAGSHQYHTKHNNKHNTHPHTPTDTHTHTHTHTPHTHTHINQNKTKPNNKTNPTENQTPRLFAVAQAMSQRACVGPLVKALLCTAKPVPLRLDTAEGDPELLAARQQALAAHAQRTMSQAVGRGALTLACVAPLPSDPLEVGPLAGLGPGWARFD